MSYKSKMKSLISQTLSTFSPHFLKPSHLPFYFQVPKSILCSLQHPELIGLKSSLPSIKSPVYSTYTQSANFRLDASEGSSGEIHVIVGPMFAGKTSTILRRIQDESSYGSFQVRYRKTTGNLDKVLKDLCFTGKVTEAVGLLYRTGLQVSPSTYAILLQECIHRNAYKKGRRIHAHMIFVGYAPNEYLKIKLLILYAKEGNLETAHIMLDSLLEKTLISWNALIAGYVQKGLEDMGLSLYYRMRLGGLIPDQYTFSSVFRACATLATLEQGRLAHGLMIKCQIGVNVVANSALMDMYFKCSSLSDGQRAFEESPTKNVVTWTALIAGYGHHGRIVEVLDFVRRMINEGFRPNHVTFLAVLSSCSHRGLVNEGWDYFISMTRDYGIKPRGKHYAAMVDLLGRAGRLKEAYELLLNLPYEEHSAIWGALLGACRIHGDIELAELAAKKYFELEPENAAKYIVLSNAYASFELWKNVADVRAVLRESGMKKEPSYSRIEVQHDIHFFFMSDNSHKDMDLIYEMIRDMTCILKSAGYVPDTCNE